jgi:dUTP pyrophosphatase
MSNLIVQLEWLPHGSGLNPPEYQSEHAAAMDLAAAVEKAVVIAPGERRLIPCGFRMAVPRGYEAQVRPRSGLASRDGITVINSPGTVDADYRGEVKIALVNLGDQPFTVERGMRIAQMLVTPVPRVTWQVVQQLPASTRGSGGFGHTGV